MHSNRTQPDVLTRFIKPIADAEFRRISVIMAGLTKMYIGDIIEESLKVMQGEKKTNSAQGPPGPLHPHHVREVSTAASVRERWASRV